VDRNIEGGPSLEEGKGLLENWGCFPRVLRRDPVSLSSAGAGGSSWAGAG
jgi:hypothetical protein